MKENRALGPIHPKTKTKEPLFELSSVPKTKKKQKKQNKKTFYYVHTEDQLDSCVHEAVWTKTIGGFEICTG